MIATAQTNRESQTLCTLPGLLCPSGLFTGCAGQEVGATMKPEQLEALCKRAKHEIKIFVNRIAKREIAAMRAAWGVKP